MFINGSSHAEKNVSIDPNSMEETTQQSRSTPIKQLPSLPTTYKFLSTSLPNSPRMGASSRNQTLDASLARSPLTCLSNTRLEKRKSGGGQRSPPHGGSDPWVTLKEHKNGDDHKVTKPTDMDFKCGSLCLFLPGFGKGKPVRARRVEAQVISETISLEKFECGSWRSSAIHADDLHSSTHYFDLPLELIRTSVSDSALPMNSGFLFNKGCAKGVLKTRGESDERKSQEGRHVRFSNSCPIAEPTSPSSCITPRLRKAREDFNAFLEAQSA